ncbi:hypothetical protein [Erythrobacter litoralis]|nr:hypothetical protein [Erythrobacter litoralis]
MKSIIKLIAGIAFTVLVSVYLVTRFMLDIIGYTTAPDDFELLQKRMPSMLEWLFSTPWWVAALFQAGIIALAAWLIISGTRRAAADEIDEHISLDRDQVFALIDSKLAGAEQAGSDSDLGALIDARLDEFLATKLRAEFITNAQHHAVDESLGEIGKRVEVAKLLAEGAHSGASQHIERIDARMAEIARGCADLEQKFQDWSKQHSDSTRRSFDNLNASFAAIGHWLWHSRYFPALLEKGNQLKTLPKVEMSDEIWESWSDTEKDWRSDVGLWADIAEFYAPNTKSAIFEVKDEMLYGDWDFDQSKLGSDVPDRLHRYKVMAITLHNMRHMREHIERCMERAAFDGASHTSGPIGVNRPGRPFLRRLQQDSGVEKPGIR